MDSSKENAICIYEYHRRTIGEGVLSARDAIAIPTPARGGKYIQTVPQITCVPHLMIINGH